MDREQLTKLVKRYLKRKATSVEREFLDTYDKRFDSEPVPVFSKDQAADMEEELFQRIRYKIEDNRQVTVIRKIRFRTFRIAASVLVLMGLFWLVYANRHQVLDIIDPIHITEITVPRGKIKKLVLADGTKVVLNAGSKFSYPDKFRSQSREVKLEGEGFFDVTHDAAKPFIIGTGKLVVQVLGTSFNVKAYDKDATAEVAVLTGKVSVQSQSEGKVQQKFITPLQKITYNVSTGRMEQLVCDSGEILDWQAGILNFKNKTLGEIIAILERKYLIDVQVDKPGNGCLIYAKIGNETADITLNALAKLLNAKVRKKGNIYQLSGISCD